MGKVEARFRDMAFDLYIALPNLAMPIKLYSLRGKGQFSTRFDPLGCKPLR
ncbi:Uncharacterised protein [Vibrio cholerae]|nr:Uncharacterised protein [Vibrio cholerae]